MKTVLMCHGYNFFNKEIVSRWLATFSEVVGIVIINEHPDFKKKRYKYEFKRSGLFGFIDIILFKVYHRLFLKKKEAKLNREILENCLKKFPKISKEIPVFVTDNPNNLETEKFIKLLSPDLMIVRAKMLLKPNIFESPKIGSFVLHPGVCPQYRNAHGCFWAIANRDYKNVAVTLLKIDKGIDTGPIYGYFSYDYDPKKESHNIIQTKVVSENFDQIKDKLIEIANNNATKLNTENLPSGVYGQPKLSAYLLRYKNAEV